MTNDARIRYTLRLPDELMKKIQAETAINGTSKNAFILQILWQWAEKKEKTEKE